MKKSSEQDHLYKRLKQSLILVVVIWLCVIFVFLSYGNAKGPGEFGDTFGVVNSLFTGMAFALLIFTSLMQKEELQLQREELSLTRSELAKSAEAQAQLVKLTQEQLKLSIEMRNTQMMPELKVDSIQWRKDDLHLLDIQITILYKSARIRKIEITGPQGHRILIQNDPTSPFFLKNDDTIQFQIFRIDTGKSVDGVSLKMYFQDVNFKTYRGVNS